ncbi:MAG TPA: hypothetical protein VFQ70_02805 [Candidatus Saccharimonadaceae bacterium]|nr:hypothetical protein [Candidatus Saccharimonadaceae bacterium]
MFLLIFAALGILTYGVRTRLSGNKHVATGMGGIVMALGIFTLFALTELPFYTPVLGEIVALEVLVLWLFIAWGILKTTIRQRGRQLVDSMPKRFLIGTWVAGTAVLATLMVQVLPELWWLIDSLSAIALCLYLGYIVIVVYEYLHLLTTIRRQRATGVVLLATVATESIVIMLQSVIGSQSFAMIARGLMIADTVILLIGLVLIVVHYRRLALERLENTWVDADCIIHGAVSITGLAIVRTHGFSIVVAEGMWGIAAVLFVVVELLEVLRMIERVHADGWREGLFRYNVAQWTRNFTFGMFYAFSLALSRVLPSGGLLRGVADYGQYVVLLFLLVEVCLFCARYVTVHRHEVVAAK